MENDYLVECTKGLDKFVSDEKRQHEIEKRTRDPLIQALLMYITERDQIVYDALKKRIEELEARLATIEAKGISYEGVYQRAQTYKRGMMVTHEGSLWCAIQTIEPGQIPGSDSKWHLAAKAGRDARAPTNHSGRPR